MNENRHFARLSPRSPKWQARSVSDSGHQDDAYDNDHASEHALQQDISSGCTPKTASQATADESGRDRREDLSGQRAGVRAARRCGSRRSPS